MPDGAFDHVVMDVLEVRPVLHAEHAKAMKKRPALEGASYWGASTDMVAPASTMAAIWQK